MNDKKTDILLAARKLFSGKSFSSVSMQAIAEECKVSKASLYKLFESKEDLLLELLDFNQKQMVAAASLLNEETSLSAEERLAIKLMAELEGFHLYLLASRFTDSDVRRRHYSLCMGAGDRPAGAPERMHHAD